jgi:hypothetical protein
MDEYRARQKAERAKMARLTHSPVLSCADGGGTPAQQSSPSVFMHRPYRSGPSAD